MKTLAYITVVLALAAETANARIITDPSEGALQMGLLTDPWGNAVLFLPIGAPAVVEIDSYEIWSLAGTQLDPAAWISIHDRSLTDPGLVITELGPEALTFAEVSATTALLSEANAFGVAVVDISTWFPIGKPMASPWWREDLRFYYTKPTHPGDKFLGWIPEPATLALLGMGGLAVLRRRRSA